MVARAQHEYESATEVTAVVDLLQEFMDMMNRLCLEVRFDRMRTEWIAHQMNRFLVVFFQRNQNSFLLLNNFLFFEQFFVWNEVQHSKN